MFVFVVVEFFSVEVFEAPVGVFEFTCGEPESCFVMDDAAQVFPGAFEGDVCSVYGKYGEEVFPDALFDCGFDLFFCPVRCLAFYPVADGLFECVAGSSQGFFGYGGEEVCPRGKAGALDSGVEFLCGVSFHFEVADGVFSFLLWHAVSVLC